MGVVEVCICDVGMCTNGCGQSLCVVQACMVVSVVEV